jgi:hypothetical protein
MADRIFGEIKGLSEGVTFTIKKEVAPEILPAIQ